MVIKYLIVRIIMTRLDGLNDTLTPMKQVQSISVKELQTESSFAVDRKKWATMTIFEQMGNIYSEVGRSFNAKRRGDTESAQTAAVRAIDLFDATTEVLIAKKSIKAKEVLCSKDQYLTVFYGDSGTQEEQSLNKYFMQFALAARINK